MKLKLRISFRSEEIAACAGVAALAGVLSQHGTSPFWMDFDEQTFESISRMAPRVLRDAHLSRIDLSKREMASVKFFEVLPRKLLKVSDADFEVWRRDCTNPVVIRSPDGLRIKRVSSLTLSSGYLDIDEIGSPESGEACLIARRETLGKIEEAGISGFVSRRVNSNRCDSLITLDPKQILVGCSENLSFAASLTDDGCKSLDRAAILALDFESSRTIEAVALLPESRHGCSGTVVATVRVLETLDRLGISGLRFAPMVVTGDELWCEAKTLWGRLQTSLWPDGSSEVGVRTPH